MSFKHKRVVLGLFVLAVVALMPSVARADVCGGVAGNIVVNCGFDTGSFPPWTVSGNCGSFCNVVGFNSHAGGTHSAQLGPVGSNGMLQQTLATVAGTTYHIEFWLLHPFSCGSAAECHLSASFGGTTFVASVPFTAFAYTLFSGDVMASGASTVLQFTFQEDPDFYYLDDISVAPTTGVVPEPGSLALLGSGLSLFAGFARRRLGTLMSLAG